MSREKSQQQQGGALVSRDLPTSVKCVQVPLERANPLLSCTIGKWLKAHGRTVKPKLTEEQKANLRMCFRMMDADGSGSIDAEELGAAFRLLGLSVTKKEAEAILAEVDRDGSGEVEYAEFLEIMTQQLTLLAAQKDDVTASRGSPQPAAGQQPQAVGGQRGRQGAGSGAAAGANHAAVLPLDVVATAYRRKKLLRALQDDDKDFIMSVAEAEEEERRLAEQEAEQAQQAAARRHRKPSTTPGAHGTLSVASSSAGVEQGEVAAAGEPSATACAADQLASHASFLDSLSAEERRIIAALEKKRREAARQQADGRRLQGSPSRAAGQAAAPAWRPAMSGQLHVWQQAAEAGAHLAAIQEVGQSVVQAAAAAVQELRVGQLHGLGGEPRAGSRSGAAAVPRSASLPSPASSALLKQPVYYRWKTHHAGVGVPPAPKPGPEDSQGLQLLAPQFSRSRV